VLARFLALVADLHAAGEALVFDLLKAGIVGRKVFVELPEGVAKLGGGDGLSAIHADTMPFVPPCCQGIITSQVQTVEDCGNLATLPAIANDVGEVDAWPSAAEAVIRAAG